MARKSAEHYEWMVGVCSSDSERISLDYMRGTVDEMKRFLVKLAKEDRDYHDSFDFGPNTAKDIEKDVVSTEYGEDVTLSAENVYSDSHTVFTARTQPVSVEISELIYLVNNKNVIPSHATTSSRGII